MMSAEQNRKKKNLRARDLNLVMILVSFGVLAAIFTISTVSASKLNRLQTSMSKYSVFKKSSIQMREASNYLTDQSRLFVITGDIQYSENYFYETDINKERSNALQNLLTVFDYNEIEFKKLSTAFFQSESLSGIEKYAMKLRFLSDGTSEQDLPHELYDIPLKDEDLTLSKAEMKQQAIEMLFDKGYLIYKMRINESCNYIINTIEYANEQEVEQNFMTLRKNIFYLSLAQILIFVIIATVFTINIIVIINPLNNFMKSIEKGSKLTVQGAYELRCFANIYNKFFELKAANERRLKRHAETDPLTGLMNRRAFDQICTDCSASPQKLVYLTIDVDDFKRINDTYGHIMGDKVLKIIAQNLTDTFRTTDYVSRVGGDEFAVLLTGFKSNVCGNIKNKITKLNNKLSKISEFGGVSLSVGAAMTDQGFYKELVEKADIALYRTKKDGKCGFTEYTPAIDEPVKLK
ncbi:MAG: GGDEF domain-containing protein [Treponema sp.]|nr:GGDEF domain-containing protein [Candidatus Treponema equi]